MISLADIGLSTATTGLSSKELNEIQIDKPNSSAPKPPNEQFLKYEYMFGEVSFETILAHGFLPWELMDEDEKGLMKEYYITLEVLYQSGTITKEQYEKEMTRIESQDGKPVKGYWYESAHGGNVSYTYDETWLVGGYAAYRAVRIFGPVIWSSPFIQRMITNDKFNTAQTTTLGKWQDIQQYKGTMNMLNINPKVFRIIKFFGKGWEVNRMWLDRCIARGDIFYLGSNAQQYLTGNSYFSKELQYMISQGYRIIGNYLVR